MLFDFIDKYVARYQPYKEGRWCYEDGCIYRGLELLHVETGEQKWLDHLLRLCDAQVGHGGSLKGYNLTEYNIDNILPGRALLYLHSLTGNRRYVDAADLLARQLSTHPRTRSGVFWHKLRYPWQIWLDGLYMAHPFRIAHALAHEQHSVVTDSLHQISTAMDVLFDLETGLYKHAFDEACEQPWVTSANGQSQAMWSRAIGWLTMALVDVAELVGPDFAPLRARTVALLKTVQSYQQADGLWLQVMDRPELTGNYGESSASAMFTYALLKAARLGLVAQSAGLVDTLSARCIKPAADGGHEMVGMCWVAGLGMFEGRYRDGTAEYYVSERKVADDAKGVAPLMMAAALEYLPNYSEQR
ncbi:MAG: glycoside hydrolase family 105 protein [Granulosicoccus sp.]